MRLRSCLATQKGKTHLPAPYRLWGSCVRDPWLDGGGGGKRKLGGCVSSGINQRKVEDIWMDVWSVEFWDEEFYNRSPWQQEKTSLQVTKKLQRIGAAGLWHQWAVFLRPNQGCTSADSHAHLHSLHSQHTSLSILLQWMWYLPYECLSARHCIITQDWSRNRSNNNIFPMTNVFEIIMHQISCKVSKYIFIVFNTFTVQQNEACSEK